MTEKTLSILDGNTFLVTDVRGDVTRSPDSPAGLFSFDTRFLSTWVLRVNGERLSPLSRSDLHFFETRFLLVPGQPTHYVNAKISVIREQSIGANFVERLVVLNHDIEPADVSIRIDADADFADIFEIKENQPKRGKRSVSQEDGGLHLHYERATFCRDTIISSDKPAKVDDGGMTFDICLEPHGRWDVGLQVKPIINRGGGGSVTVWEAYRRRSRPQVREELEHWIDRAPRLASDYEPLTAAYKRSLYDLAAMRYSSLTAVSPIPTAGLPWYMTLLGRDSIFISLQTLPFAPTLTPPVLRLLGALQGTTFDDFREEEPGKILHEFRYGESAAFEEQPHTPYYGSADASPLFVILLDEYERWSGDVETVRLFEPQARAALNWIDEYADLLGTGYVYYWRRNTRNGLENQCWKDSSDAISYRDGRLPALPRATCELQGYAYDAKMRGARMAREFWNDPEYADRLEREAAQLREQFNRDFWIEEEGYYALALDPDGKPVDALASNMGHLLWSGIVEPERARRVADHLLGPSLFSGWGVRTLSTTNLRYNPIGYHVGTVWPFDNSIIAWGLWRYGLREEAARIADGMITASGYFDGRLPEAFAGYERSLTDYPVEYPTACSPQGWSAGAPLLLLRTMLGLTPHPDHLAVDPYLPSSVGRIELLDVPGRWGLADAFGRRTRRRDDDHRSEPVARLTRGE
ncbi:amylo-alpha-1,6-glucosidase [Micromonospora sp. KC207]|uniref:amylo-alpha-1,6-glucosidase n=1 Tax=Micromonospora sp. KC207 TaxID=2530377 RepID=UPI001049E82E|nr:glycogen debranching N-terminal domain-containing protein [Micromonospora sp. KC207]TDC65763.1 amylo-alpha-1,6-glucosidase [Micromonospora sp. KC207]